MIPSRESFKTILLEPVSRNKKFKWITENILYFVRIKFPMITSRFVIINLY